jgi:hypothetical protein
MLTCTVLSILTYSRRVLQLLESERRVPITSSLRVVGGSTTGFLAAPAAVPFAELVVVLAGMAGECPVVVVVGRRGRAGGVTRMT